MKNRKSLSLQIAGAMTLTMLFGTSAFAESRHPSETSRSSGGHIDRSGGGRSSAPSVPRDRSVTRTETRSSDRSSWRSNDTPRNTTRDFSQRDDSQRSVPREATRNDWRGNDNQRNDSRNNSNDRRGRFDSRNNQRGISGDRFRNVEGWRPGSRAPYSNHERVSSFGRVERYQRWHNGYRVWIGGGLYPIFVPFERWRLFPLRIGLNIRFGGYWDPHGYWSVYDYSPYDGYYGGYYDRYDTVYTRGDIRGVVESVDFRRGTLVLNDDISRQFVTVTMPRDRRMDSVRPGDYVEFSGDWSRNGLFHAYRLERFDEGRDDRRY